MKIRKIDHIGIACRDAGKAEAFYHGVLGLPVTGRHTLESMKLKMVQVRASEVLLELVEPLEGEQVISKFLDRSGEGIHHLCFEVEDIAVATEHLRKAGYAPLWEKPRPGAAGRRINFLRPKETGGVLIELSQA